jgi:hypothetical protein
MFFNLLFSFQNRGKKYFTFLFSTIFVLQFSLFTVSMGQVPVAYYPFNGNANDESGNGNNGTVFGSTLTEDRFGMSNSAYSFNGIDNYIKASATNLPSSDRTIALWFYTNDLSTHPFLLGYGGGNMGTSFYMILNHLQHPDAYHSASHNYVNHLIVPYAAPPTGQWYHWVISTDVNGTRYFINGQLYHTSTITYQNTNTFGTDFILGSGISPSGTGPYADANAGFLNGKLDDIRIYNYALPDSIITILYLEDGWNPVSSISGKKWNDGNGDGVKDANEMGIPNWKIKLFGSNVDSVFTDAYGNYTFPNLPAGTYVVEEEQQSGWMQTFPQQSYYTITLSSGQNEMNVDFGNRLTDVIVSNALWRYSFDYSEGWTNENFDDSQWLQSNAPFGNGGGCDLPYNTYWPSGTVMYLRIHFTLPMQQQLNGQVAIDNDFEWYLNGVNIFSAMHDGCPTYWDYVFPISSTETQQGENVIAVKIIDRGAVTFFNAQVKFATQNGYSISGKKWHDLDADGMKDENESSIPGWKIYLNGAISESTYTNEDGIYTFPNVPEGSYYVKEEMFPEWHQTFPPEQFYELYVEQGQSYDQKDFGNFMLPPIDTSLFTFGGLYNGHLYFISRYGKTWHQAKQDCEANLGHLVTISDASENAFVNYLSQEQQLWIGFTDEGDEGNWRWVTNEPAAYTNWDFGEPNNANGIEHYALTNWYDAFGGWTDAPENLLRFYVLEIDYLQPPQTGSVSGRKWNDANGNGVKDENEIGLANWKIYLTDSNVESTYTNEDGMFVFENVFPGQYTASEEQQSGWIQTYPTFPGIYAVTVEAGTEENDIDFGNKVATYEITATTDTNGNIIPEGTVEITHGANQTFTIFYKTGYHVASVLVDGSLVDSLYTYTFYNITANHTISVTFAINTFIISATTDGNGEITPSGNVVVNYGSNQEFLISPAEGYKLDSVFVDAAYIGDDATYEFTDVTSAHSIYATFEFLDTTKFRTLKVSDSLSIKAVKLKKGRDGKYPLPNVGNVRDSIVSKFSKGLVIGVEQTKDSAKYYGWLYWKKGTEVAKFYTSAHTGASFPIDSIRLENKKPKKIVKAFKPTRKTYNNPLAAEFAIFKMNVFASRQKITPDKFYELEIVKDGSPFDGMTTEETVLRLDTAMTYWLRDHLVRDTAQARDVYTFLHDINTAFYNPITDSATDFVTISPLEMKGLTPLHQVPFLKRTTKTRTFNPWNETRTEEIPQSIVLGQNYPNPFNPTTTIHFTLSTLSLASIKVYDILGQEVAELLSNEELDEGEHEVSFDANNLPSGVYFYRLSVSQDGIVRNSETKKLLLMK